MHLASNVATYPSSYELSLARQDASVDPVRSPPTQMKKMKSARLLDLEVGAFPPTLRKQPGMPAFALASAFGGK